MKALIHRGHSHANGGAIEALRIPLYPEQIEIAVRPAIRLGAFEYHLPAMEYLGRWIQPQRPIRDDGGIMPAQIGRIALSEHPVGEIASETEILRQRLRYDVACGFDSNRRCSNVRLRHYWIR